MKKLISILIVTVILGLLHPIYSQSFDANKFHEIIKTGVKLIWKEKYEIANVQLKQGLNLLNSEKISEKIKCQNLLASSYLSQDQFSNAKKLIDKNLEMLKNEIEKNNNNYLETLKNLCQFEISIGKYDDALQNIETAIELSEKEQNKDFDSEILEIELTELRADIFTAYSKPAKALVIRQSNLEKIKKLILKDYQQSLKLDIYIKYIIDKLYATEPVTKALFDNTQKLLFHALDMTKTYSLEKNSVSASIYELLGYSYYAEYWNIKKMHTPKNEKILYQKMKKYTEKALTIRKNIYGESHSSFASLYNNLSVVEKIPKSVIFLNKGIKIQRDLFGEKNDQMGLMYNNIGSVYRFGGMPDSSLLYYQKSLISLTGSFNSTDIFSNPELNDIHNPIYVLEILEKKAKALLLKYDTTQDIKYLNFALESYKLDLNLLENIIANFGSNKMKEQQMKGYHYLYDNALDVAMRLFKQSKKNILLRDIYQIIQDSKANILRNKIITTEIDDFGSISPELIIHKDSIHQKLINFQEIINSEKILPIDFQDKQKLIQFNDSLIIYEREYNQDIRKIKSNFPEYDKLMHPQKKSINEIQNNILDQDDAIIEYYISENKLFVFAINRDTFDFKSINHAESIIDNILKLQKIVSTKSSTVQEFITPSTYLYDSLIAPIKGIIYQKNISIVPNGALFSIPFEILLTKHTKATSWINLPYFIKQNSIGYAFSVALLEKNKKKSKNSNTKFIAFAPFSDSLFNSKIVERKNLGILQYSRDEVENLSKYFTGDIYLKTKATEAVFKNEASKFGIIYLSTHAILNDTIPTASSLYFSANQEDNGLLTINELYGQKLNAQLTVLSACNTGIGKQLTGEGSISLARAFAYAGCPNVIMSLWNVNDYTTTEITNYLMDNLHHGKTKSKALQNAKIEFLNSKADAITAHPFYWSALVTMGDNTPLDMRISNFGSKYIWFFSLVIITILIWILIRKK